MPWRQARNGKAEFTPAIVLHAYSYQRRERRTKGLHDQTKLVPVPIIRAGRLAGSGARIDRLLSRAHRHSPFLKIIDGDLQIPQ